MSISNDSQAQSHLWLLVIVLCSVISFYFGRQNSASSSNEEKSSISIVDNSINKISNNHINNNRYKFSEPINDVTCARYHNKNLTYRRDDELIAGYAPPLLISYKGSGATYLRSLIELSTGYMSGSLGTNEGEKDLIKNEYFKDDNTCQLMHSVVECPDPAAFRLSINTIGNIFFIHKKHRVRCRQGSIYGFKRAVLLVRNPVHTILASYLNTIRLNTNMKEPIENIDILKDNKWNVYFDHTATMWQQSWNATVYPLINYLVQGYSLIAIVRYEDLRNPETQLQTLHNLVTFVINKPISHHQIQCALYITEKRPSCLTDEIPSSIMEQLDDSINHENNIFQAPSPTRFLTEFTANLSFPYYSLCPGNRESQSTACTDIKTQYNRLLSENRGNIHDTAVCVNEHHGNRLFFPLDSVYENLYYENHTEGSTYLARIAYLEKLAIDEMNAPRDKKDKNDKKDTSIPDYSRMIFPYEGRNFSQLDPPPLLLSYPGSGNTWVRLLVEFSTGIYSGSIDAGDQALQEGIAGERYCSPMNSVIKAHPININASTIHHSVYLVDELHKLKCNITRSFSHVLFLVRNPYHAILAEFHRSQTKSHHAVVEVGEISDAHFHRTALDLARHYMQTWQAILEPMVQALPQGNIHVLKYELLVSKDPAVRYQALSHALAFLDYRRRNKQFESSYDESIHRELLPQLKHKHHLHTTSSRSKNPLIKPLDHYGTNNIEPLSTQSTSTTSSNSNSDEFIRRRFECAFRLSQNPKVHRKKSVKSYNAVHAYRNQTLVDAMWDYLAPFATYAGYKKEV